MKIPKCTKTISKKHRYGFILASTGEWWTRPVFVIDGYEFYIKCIACGMVDDRPQKKGDK